MHKKRRDGQWVGTMTSGFVKRIIERTRLAPVYRAAREEWRFAGLEFAETPFGYRLAGPENMRAGTFEPDEVSLLTRHLESADVFIDVGANIGYFTLLARSMGKHVVAIEPLPLNLRLLYANLNANGWIEGVEVYPVGLSDRPGLRSLYGSKTDASLVPGWSGASEAFQQTIPVTTLDTILGDRFVDRRVVIKMDIEGHEFHALLGASDILAAQLRPVWLVEITLSEHRQDGNNPHFVETFELFWDLGYEARAIGPQGRQLSDDDVAEYANGGSRPPWASVNYLFSIKNG